MKIVDFGIARARDVHEEQGVIKGKFAYMSPEQARGEPVDCRSDVFAAGIVLYELVCARPLFHGKGKEALEMVKSGAIPRPRDFAPELPESLERIILKALAFHRGDRFQTARDLQHELGRFQLEWGSRSRQPDRLGPARAAARRRWCRPSSAWSCRGRRPRAMPRRARDEQSQPQPIDAIIGEVSGKADAHGGVARSARAWRSRRCPSRASRPQKAEKRDQRERKYVYVLEGVLRGMAALEKRLGAAGAARLVNEFYKVARDVAFKHDALIDMPRADAETAAATPPARRPGRR